MTSSARLPPEASFAGTPRFEVRCLLGRGAMGAVYRALDRETGRDVALKALTAPDAEQLYHLKAEFRSLASITHANLVQLDELVATDDACFFSMELLEGCSFSEYARSLAAEGWTDETLAAFEAVSLQLVSGVSALHAAGKLHRDIKPSNVLVTNEGRTVLVDFGLCTELRLVEGAKNPMVGTLLYMAPEQAWGRPLTQAADWYAVGALLYEALNGRPAFGQAGSALLFAKGAPPRVPDGLSPRARALCEVATRMMDPDPAKRPTPTELAGVLRHDGRSEVLSTRRQVPFVGRAAELSILEAARRDVEGGRPAVVHIDGPSGIGKTELVERHLESLERSGALVLRGRCHPREAVSYNGFDGIVDALSEWLTSLPGAASLELAPADADALRAMFPVLGRVPGLGRAHEEAVDAFAARRRGFHALRALLSDIAGRRLVALAIDDAQWGGPDTAALLAEVFRPPHTPRLLLVLAYRTEEKATAPLLETLRGRAAALVDSAYQISLGPMEPADARALARSLVDERDAATVERVADGAGGHPLFLRELALAPRTSTGMASDIRSLLLTRMRALTETDRLLVELAAAAGHPLRRRVLLAATGEGERARSRLLRLTKERLLRETSALGEPGVEPYHAHVRDAALAAMAGEQRRARHRALADVLLAEPEPPADLLVDHLVGAGDRATAARFATTAAHKAEATLAFDRAAHLYRLALELDAGRDAARSARLGARLASALAHAGQSRAAADAYVAAARAAAGVVPSQAADFERRAAEHYLRGGDLDRGISRMRHVLASAGVRYPGSPAAAMAAAVALRARVGVRGLRYVLRELPPDAPSRFARADACWSAGLGLAWVDRTRTAVFQARYLLDVLDHGEPTRVTRALATEASQLASLGGAVRTERARRLLEQALSVSNDSDPGARAFSLLMAGSIEFYASRYRAALTLCQRAEQVLREAGRESEWEIMTSHTLSLASLAYLGDVRTLRVRQAELTAEAGARGNRLARVCLACGPANLGWLVADDPAEARRRNDEAIAPWRGDDFQLPHYLHLIARTQISLYEGDGHLAFRELSSEWGRLRSSLSLVVQNFRVTLRHLRARCALAALRSGELSRVERFRMRRTAQADARALLAEDVAWAAPLGLSIEAGLAAVAGDVGVCEERLERAALAYRRVDMELHAAAADHERGRLVGGDAGRALLRRAEAWMVGGHVANPERLAATLVPGI